MGGAVSVPGHRQPDQLVEQRAVVEAGGGPQRREHGVRREPGHGVDLVEQQPAARPAARGGLLVEEVDPGQTVAAQRGVRAQREVAGLLGATISRLVEGQILELQHLYDPDRSEDDYFRSIDGKTAALLATALLVVPAATTGGAPAAGRIVAARADGTLDPAFIAPGPLLDALAARFAAVAPLLSEASIDAINLKLNQIIAILKGE